MPDRPTDDCRKGSQGSYTSNNLAAFDQLAVNDNLGDVSVVPEEDELLDEVGGGLRAEGDCAVLTQTGNEQCG